jgi:hypothetical protein
MPALLPPEKRKSLVAQVRFLESEIKILKAQAKLHKCRNISEYLRKLVRDDLQRTRNSLPDLC